MPWNENELVLLRLHYPSMPLGELAVVLNKTPKAICHKASRENIPRLTRHRKKRGITVRKIIDARYYARNKKEIFKQRSLRAKAVKRELVLQLGGKCKKCGYDKCFGALDFHHLRDKKDLLSVLLGSDKYDEDRLEAQKCELLCANCHREFHYKGN